MFGLLLLSLLDQFAPLHPLFPLHVVFVILNCLSNGSYSVVEGGMYLKKLPI